MKTFARFLIVGFISLAFAVKSETLSPTKFKVSFSSKKLTYKDCLSFAIEGGTKPYSYKTSPEGAGQLRESQYCATSKVFGPINIIFKDANDKMIVQKISVAEPFQSVSLDSKKWTCPLCMPKPVRIQPFELSGWFFDFPKFGDTSVNYVMTLLNKGKTGKYLVEGARLRAKIRIESTPGTVFTRPNIKVDPSTFPPNTRFYFSKLATLFDENGRWWARNVYLKLEDGSAIMEAKLDPSEWSNVYGHLGSESEEYTKQFRLALRNAVSMGITFGGGYSFGHGVNIKDGEARFIMEDFTYDIDGGESQL